MSDEKVLWTDHAGMEDFKVNPMHWFYSFATLGLYFLCIYIDRKFVRYTLTTERIIKDWGVFTRSRDEVELYRIKDVIFRATIFQRFVGTGDIEVISSDVTGKLLIENLTNAFSKREQIRAISRKLRTENGVRSILHE
jgi:uncharacterized membrane protein YdbT with pleckstrin-like domain